MKWVQRGKKEQREERNMPLSNKNLKQQRNVRNSMKAVFLWPRLTLISQAPPQKKKNWKQRCLFWWSYMRWRQWVWWNQNKNYERSQVPSRNGMSNHRIRIPVPKKHISDTWWRFLWLWWEDLPLYWSTILGSANGCVWPCSFTCEKTNSVTR